VARQRDANHASLVASCSSLSLNLQSGITHILGRHFNHTSAAREQPHGPDAGSALPKGSSHCSSPLFRDTRDWVRTLPNSGQTLQQIMRKTSIVCQGCKECQCLGRDAALKPQDVLDCDWQKDRADCCTSSFMK